MRAHQGVVLYLPMARAPEGGVSDPSLLRIDLDDDGDAYELDRSARALRSELLQLDTLRVDRIAIGAPPPGARGDGLAVGALAVALANSAVLVAVCRVVQTWVANRLSRTATIRYRGRSLTLSGMNREEQTRLIDGFLRDLGDGGAGNDDR
jgi:hypothetical protein